jgi:ribosomal protein S27AE
MAVALFLCNTLNNKTNYRRGEWRGLLRTGLNDRHKNKACPKCGGTLFEIGDIHGEYEQCLQCGFIKYPNTIKLSEPKEGLVSSKAS